MADYYQLLGIRQDATPTEIRSAYKRLAMLYHPDRNPGNQEAEELFKLINEAYHVLADPAKKAYYDTGIAYPKHTYHSTAHDTSAYWKEYHRQRYEQWRHAQQSTYTFDKRYFRIQALAIGVFLIIAGFCFALINVIEYVHEERLAENHRKNLALIGQVNALFSSGHQEEAIQRIRTLQKDEPLDFIFTFAEDSLLSALRKQANLEFDAFEFEKAREHFKLLQRFEEPISLQTIQRIAECDYYTGQFEESIVSLKELLEVQPKNIDLIYRIAIIYQDDVKDLEQALFYLSMGRKSFKEHMTNLYGEAFEIIMEPRYVHDIFVDIFNRRAEVNLALKKYTDAEKDCSWAIMLRPNEAKAYFNRSLAAIHSGNRSRLCDDLRKAESLGHGPSKSLRKKHCAAH